MRIAVMADRPTLDATVAEIFEESPAMFVIETDDNSVVELIEGPDVEKYITAMLMNECEAVVCTPQIGEDAFEPIAGAGITRYDGNGLPVLEAARRALFNELGLVTDFEGGTGCHSGEGVCSEGHCGE